MTTSIAPISNQLTGNFPQGGGEMGELIRSFAWQNTSLGPIENWPLSLRTLVNMMLASRFPMLIFWGKELITFYNDAFRPSLGNGGKHPSSLGQRGQESWAESWPVIGPMIQNIVAGGEAVWFEDQKLPIYREGNMSYAYWTYSFSPVTDDDGYTNGALVTCTETTKAVEAIADLEKSEGQFKNLVRETTAGIAVLIGPDFRIEIVNKAFAQLVGRTAEELLGKNQFDVIPEAEAVFRPVMEQALQQSEPLYLSNVSYSIFNNKGETNEGIVNITYQPYKEASGEVTGLILLCQDVTLQQKAQQQLQESEARFRDLIEQAPVASCLFTGRQMKIEVANEMMLALWGKGAAALGKPLSEALPELKGQPFLQILDDVFTTGKTYSATDARAELVVNGTLQTFYFDFTYKPVFNTQGQVYGVIDMAVDVTEQVLANYETKQAEKNLRMAVDAAALATFSLDVENETLQASPRLKDIFGFGQDEEMPYVAATGQIREDYRKQVSEAMEMAIAGNTSYNTEYPVIGFNDGKTRWVRAVGTVQTRNDGKKYLIGIMNDITEKKLDEIRKNDFISMVSHELKTPLTSMSGYLQFLQAKATKNGDTFSTGILQKANKQVGKMTTMINGFLNVSRLESGKLQIDKARFDMAVLMKDIEEETHASVLSHEIVFRPVDETWVFADRDKIWHVVNNFISNAVKYSPAGSVVQIACVTIEGKAQVTVKDKGIGISPDDIPKLFDRYYRVGGDSTIAGFGIGLYLCKEIIDRHGGTIGVQSEPGKGSTFCFALPVTD